MGPPPFSCTRYGQTAEAAKRLLPAQHDSVRAGWANSRQVVVCPAHRFPGTTGGVPGPAMI